MPAAKNAWPPTLARKPPGKVRPVVVAASTRSSAATANMAMPQSRRRTRCQRQPVNVWSGVTVSMAMKSRNADVPSTSAVDSDRWVTEPGRSERAASISGPMSTKGARSKTRNPQTAGLRFAARLLPTRAGSRVAARSTAVALDHVGLATPMAGLPSPPRSSRRRYGASPTLDAAQRQLGAGSDKAPRAAHDVSRHMCTMSRDIALGRSVGGLTTERAWPAPTVGRCGPFPTLERQISRHGP